MDRILKTVSILEALPDELTKKELELIWCREVLRRNDGNRTKCSRVLGVTYHTVVNYVRNLKTLGLDAENPKRGVRKEIVE